MGQRETPSESTREDAAAPKSREAVQPLPDGREAHYRQAVIVAFESGYRKVANVEGDSEWGCIEDVMKCILR